jgi:inosine/xanthosine triphosphatase
MTATNLGELRLVAVGSTNPVKVDAVRTIVQRLAPGCAVVGTAVQSGVPDQPWGDEETAQGALTRARTAIAATGADLAVGLEGGVVSIDGDGVRTCAWAAAVSRDGREGIGGSLAMTLPEPVAALVRAGVELGDAMDRITGAHGVKQGPGAVGILTAGLVSRQQAYEMLVAYALAPLIGVVR